jgi:hypothetical protein
MVWQSSRDFIFYVDIAFSPDNLLADIGLSGSSRRVSRKLTQITGVD